MDADFPTREEIVAAQGWLRSGAPSIRGRGADVAPETAVRTLLRLIAALPSLIPGYRWPNHGPYATNRLASAAATLVERARDGITSSTRIVEAEDLDRLCSALVRAPAPGSAPERGDGEATP